MLGDLAAIIAKPLFINFDGSQQKEDVSEDWRKTNIISIFRKDNREDPGSNSSTSIPGKVKELSASWDALGGSLPRGGQS